MAESENCDPRRREEDDNILAHLFRRSTDPQLSRLQRPDSRLPSSFHNGDSFYASRDVNANTGDGQYYNISNSKVTFHGLSDRERLFKWLNISGAAAVARDRNHNDFSNFLQKMKPGTGDWLLGQNKSYLNWSSSEAPTPAVLWLYGQPGFGKSVLCAHAIQKAIKRAEASEDSRKPVVAYQLYSWDSEPETTTTALLNLADALVTCYPDRPGRDEAFKGILRASVHLDSLKDLIKILVRKFSGLYLFIDGLDELVDAAGNIFAKKGPPSAIKRIPLHEGSNLSDIAVLFEETRQDAMNSIQARANLDQLQPLVGSNFLWAKWMLEDFSKPRIEEENLVDPTRVPRSLGEYLRRRITQHTENDPKSRLAAALILSFLVYAKRPLSLEELRDAVCAALVSEPGDDIGVTTHYGSDTVEEICAPFVRVDNIETNKGKVQTVYRLYHASVQGFLLENLHVLREAARGSSHGSKDREKDKINSNDDGLHEDDEYSISPQLLARACLRYLQQNRYKEPLKIVTLDNKFDFAPAEIKPGQEQSVEEHHLLVYAAKYWVRHLQHPDLNNSSKRRRQLYGSIEKFVRSSHFHTMLQVQSTFVGGQFHFWHSTETNRTGFVRALPSYFSESEAGVRLQRQYNEAMGEWGYFLREHSCYGKSCAGQINLCLWGTLGTDHFLNPMPGMPSWIKYPKSYKMEGKWDPPNNAENVEIEVESWTIKPEKMPEVNVDTKSPTHLVAVEDLELYEVPLKKDFVGRPRAIAISSDGEVLRVGSAIYVRKDESLKRVSIEGLKPDMHFFGEMGQRDNSLVLARRGHIKREDLIEQQIDSGYVADQEDTHMTIGSDDESDGKRVDSQYSTPQGSDCESDAGEDGTDEPEIKDPSDGDDWASPSEASVNDDEWDSDVSDQLSEELDMENLPEDFEADWYQSDSSNESNNGLTNTLRWRMEANPASMLQKRKSKKDKPVHLCELVIFDTTTKTTSESHDAPEGGVTETETHFGQPLKPIRMFHFALKSKNLLFTSPPVIHPTKPLAVWPIAGGEIVFAHFSPGEKTFFTRSLGAGDEVCHISMQSTRETIRDLLRVATYRLSRRKTARSPPKLIYQTSCMLPQKSFIDPADGGNLFMVAPLPWTLTWDWGADDWGHVYACQSSKLLRVVRLPLFAKVQVSDRASMSSNDSVFSGRQSSTKITANEAAFTNKGQVFLPKSADDRRVHFIPFRSMGPEEPGGKKGQKLVPRSPETKKLANKSAKTASDIISKTSKGKNLDRSSRVDKAEDEDLSERPGDFVGTLVLSSEDARNRPDGGISLRNEPPPASSYSDRAQVVYMRERQFGGWVPLLPPEGDDAMTERVGNERTESRWMAHLKDKVEKFDRDDDCDIVDFIR
ncbi:hypothetical protein CPLU01_15362 [Colletotrichum plurivorum]|uniref:Nephrocystin 3-like N-terminal domain-containing protein n=1 Tax=Colletotrichum plurivorum TaxID=2175906 RepID=A0A8H6JBV5_9PEZI|nr:hypothetical protein CPLU01_15362 [Colletotrichum plurivorum]